MQSFTVVPEGSRIFRTVLTDLKLSLPKSDENQSHVFLKGNFDNFRTFYTPQCPDLAIDSEFPDYTISFMYETQYSHLLLFKLFRLSVYCHDWNMKKSDLFVGEAACDLQTLATGPEDVNLVIYDGDTEVGHIHFNLIFREESEVLVKIPRIDISMPNHNKLEFAFLAVTKRGGGTAETRSTALPQFHDSKKCVASYQEANPEHYFGVSVTRFLEECGYDIVVYDTQGFSHKALGQATLLFSAHMSGEMKNELDFHDVDIKDMEGANKLGSMSGRITFSGLPLFVQMYAGRNINGKIYGGKVVPGQFPKPLYVSDEGIQTASVV